jgi:redox-sensitive bicupin YhaK (pirin superfamily)
MITKRPAQERGHIDHGWLDTWHTFSFADYYDPAHMSFRSLRVMNDDRVAPGQGFGMHPHRDMEIVTYVLEGELEHKDSLGHGAVLRAGEVQRISAGTGVLHSEFNPSSTEWVHLYQIWLLPDRKGHQPRYDQSHFPVEGRCNRWQTIVTPSGQDSSLSIHQDATIALARLDAGRAVTYTLAAGRHGWLQVLRGAVHLNDLTLSVGDGAAIAEDRALNIVATTAAEVMLFDLA